jgi:hypothetical protein
VSQQDPRRHVPFRPGPDIAPRPGQAEEALAEVLRRRRRKAAVAAVVITLGVATGGVALALIPRGTPGQDTLQVASLPRHTATASVSPPLTRTPPTKSRATPAASTSSRAPGSKRSSAPVVAPPTSLAPGSPVEGLVRDPAGNPLPGIAVYAAAVASSERLAVSDAEGRFSVPCADIDGSPLLLADTDAGHWAWQLLGGGTSLSAAVAPACGTQLTAVLDPASAVTGQYDRDGAPGAGSVVTVTCVDAPALPLAATVAADGSYQLGGLAPGTCTVLHTTEPATCASVDDPTIELQAGEALAVNLHDTGCSAPTSTGSPTPAPSTAPAGTATPAPTPTPTQ